MRFAAPHSWTTILLALLCLSFNPAARADTFAFTVVGTTNQGSFVAADDFGDYTIRLNGSYSDAHCGTSANSCYQTYSAYSQQNYYTTYQPTLTADPAPAAGTGCTYNVALISGGVSFCNNGHQDIGNIAGVWSVDGTNIALVYSAGAPANSILISASGNFVFADGLNENLIAAIDLTTIQAAVPLQVSAPEPGSLCLLATGTLGILGTLRRRYAA